MAIGEMQLTKKALGEPDQLAIVIGNTVNQKDD
jgi:hypothetical protein